MPRLTETQRQVVERRIQEAGGAEQAGISRFRGGAARGFGQAPSIADILGAAQGGLTAEDRNLLQQATFGGITEGLQPQLRQALQFAREQATSRGLSDSTISAGLQGQVTQGILAPALAQAQRQFAAGALGLPFQRAQALSGVRGQAFGELQAALARDLEERGQNVTTTQRQFQRQRGLFSRILGAGLGQLAGSFLGGAGGLLAGRLFGGGEPQIPQSAVTSAVQTGSPRTQGGTFSSQFTRPSPGVSGLGPVNQPPLRV